MPHVELSLTDLPRALSATVIPRQAQPGRAVAPGMESIRCWSAAVEAASEPCLLIDHDAVIVAISVPCQRLLALADAPIGRGLLDGVLQLLDFSADAAALTPNEVGKIPPLLALSSGRLARGLVRVKCAQQACTLDAIATPLGDEGHVVGSLTFLSRV